MGQMGSIKKEEEKFSSPVIENKDGDSTFLTIMCPELTCIYTITSFCLHSKPVK